MKCRLGELSQTMDGEIIFPVITRDKSALALWDSLHDKPVRVDCKEWKNRRSLDANAYFHVLCNQIAAAMKIGNDECKRQLVLDYGTLDRDKDGKIAGAKLPASVDILRYYSYAKPYSTEIINGREYIAYLFYKPTHELDTREMARLIDGAVNEAKQLGIETLPPHELAALEYEGGRMHAKQNAET